MTNATATSNEILRKTADHVRELLAADASGHDWWHIQRVRAMALKIGRAGACRSCLSSNWQLCCTTSPTGSFTAATTRWGPRGRPSGWPDWESSRATIDHVCQIIAQVSFKGAGVDTPMHSLEGQVVQDADRLDALGAIGIARTFAYGGHAGRVMHDPAIPPSAARIVRRL